MKQKKKDGNNKKTENALTDELMQSMNIQYFKISYEQDLAKVLEAVAQRHQSQQGSNYNFLNSMYNTVKDKFQGKQKWQTMNEKEKIHE